MDILLQDEDALDEDEPHAALTNHGSDVQALKQRRAMVVAQLHSVSSSIRSMEAELLRAANLPGTSLTLDDQGDGPEGATFEAFLTGPGDRRFTERAQEKVARLLDLCDDDRDGRLNFREFRGYLKALRRDRSSLGVTLTENSEYWLAYMWDLYGADPKGLLELPQFIEYRRATEQEHPLEEDLLALGLDLVPLDLRRWSDGLHEFERMERQDVTEEPLRIKGCIPLTDLQLLAANCGEIYSDIEVQRDACRMVLHNAVLASVREAYRRKNQFSSVEESETLPTDLERLHRDSFLAWWMSGRGRPLLLATERVLVRAKTCWQWAFRSAAEALDAASNKVSALLRRGVITASLLEACKKEEARVNLNVAVGDVQDDGSGFSAFLSYRHRFNSTDEAPVHQLPNGMGMEVTVDLEARPDATDAAVEHVARVVSTAAKSVLLPELRRLPSFHALKVVTAVSEDGTKLVRMLLHFRSTANIDWLLRKAGLHTLLCELVSDFTAELFCPTPLPELFQLGKSVLDKRLLCNLSASATVSRGIVSRVLEESLNQSEEEIRSEGADAVEQAEEHRAHRQRTAQSDVAAQHPPGPPAHRQHQARRKTCREGQRDRTARARLMRWAWKLLAQLKGTQALSLEVQAASLSELLLDNAWCRAVLSRRIKREVLLEAGWLVRWLQGVRGRLQADMDCLEEALRKHDLEVARRLREQEARQRTRRADKDGQRKLKVLEELKALGVATTQLDAALFAEKGDPQSVDGRLWELQLQQMEEYKALMQAFHGCTQHLLGVKRVMVQSGMNILDIEAMGLDVSDLFA